MAKYSNDERRIWLNGKIVPVGEAMINVLSPTSQFGANVFEGIRCYYNADEDQLFAFRLNEHYKRLENSMKLFRFDTRYTQDELYDGLIETVRANDYREDIAVRQTVFLDGFGTWSTRGPIGMFIAPVAKPRTVLGSTGKKCCISSWERISDRNFPPRIKVGANYINSRLAQIEAVNGGYDTAIFMNHLGKIAEGPGSCFFIVRDGTLITPPCTASVLESITRDTVIELARNVLGIPTEIRDIDRTETYICDEAFLCGSAMEVAPVTNIDGYDIGTGSTGEITRKLHSLYLDVVSGRVPQYKGWLTPIYEDK